MNILKQETGFSLIELLVSLTIIALLSTTSLLVFKTMKKKASDVVLKQAAGDLIKASIQSHLEIEVDDRFGSSFCITNTRQFVKTPGQTPVEYYGQDYYLDSNTGTWQQINREELLKKSPYTFYKPNPAFYSYSILAITGGNPLLDAINVFIADCSTNRYAFGRHPVGCNSFGFSNVALDNTFVILGDITPAIRSYYCN